MDQTPRARTQLANVPRTLQQVPTGAITRTTHSQLYGFHNQSTNNADKILNKLYDKISAGTTKPATYYKKSEAEAANQMNQHMQQLAQETQQNTHMQNVLQNLNSQVTNLKNQLNSAPHSNQQHPGYQHQAYP